MLSPSREFNLKMMNESSPSVEALLVKDIMTKDACVIVPSERVCVFNVRNNTALLKRAQQNEQQLNFPMTK